MMLQGRRFESLDAMTSAMDEVAGNDSWRTAHEKCEGWYCTERSEEDGILDLFFVPPMPYATRHGLNTIPLGGPRGWSYSEDPEGLTVSPSIFISPSATPPGWHGFLERGVWRTV